jgi:hypothetical protein
MSSSGLERSLDEAIHFIYHPMDISFTCPEAGDTSAYYRRAGDPRL